MAVDVKVIRVYLWRFSVLLAGICCRFAQKHPCISGTLLSLFVLYVFFPMVFRLLIYSSPIMICAYYAYGKNVLKSEHPEAWKKKDDETRIQKKDEQMNNVISELTLGKKRNVFFEQNGRIEAEEKNMINADFVPDLHRKPLGDEKLKKAVRESEADILGKAENELKKANREWGKAENAETGDDDWRKSNGGDSESDILDKAEYEEDEETQEEDAQEDLQKAVEWTEEDQRNLMDLGTSETERDGRLESLIQNRRARKLLSMQVRNVIDIIRHPPNQVAPLVIARSTCPFTLINTLSDTDDLHMPGSAPSVLLPSRSPFDLPYDPFEERPNLTGDGSFEREFTTADHKDFCRHESFFLGGHFGPRQDGNSLNSFINTEKMKGVEGRSFSRFRSYTDRGSYETISPGASSVEHELMTCIDAHDSGCEEQSLKQPSKSEKVSSMDNAKSENSKNEDEEKCDSESISASSCAVLGTEGAVEADSGNFLCDNQVEDTNRNMNSEDLSSYLHKSLGSSMQETAVKEAKENGHAQSHVYISSRDLFNVHKRALHTPAHSIASDLVVEVSEAGSPPPTLSPPDGDSSPYDGDVDRDLSSGSDELSMHVYRMEEQETRPSEGHASGKEGFGQGESIPEAVELEQDGVDGYERTSPTSSDDNSSYENVVQHLSEKLKARCLGSKVIMGTPEVGPSELSGPALTESTAIVHFDEETGLDVGTSVRRELDGDSSKQDYASLEDIALPMEGHQGSSNLQVAEDVHGDTEMRSSDEVALPAEHQAQAQAIEEVPEITSPKSVLPDTDFRDQIPRIVGQTSDLADSPSDATLLENSTTSMADTRSAQHMENQDSRSQHSEPSIEQGHNKNDEAASMIHKTGEEAGNLEVKQGITDDISVSTGADEATAAVTGREVVNKAPVSEKGPVLMVDLPLSNNWNADDEFNGLTEKSPDFKESSTAESSKQKVDNDPTTLGEPSTASASNIDASEGNLDNTSAKSTEPPSKLDSLEAPVPPDMDPELQIHRISETCM